MYPDDPSDPQNPAQPQPGQPAPRQGQPAQPQPMQPQQAPPPFTTPAPFAQAPPAAPPVQASYPQQQAEAAQAAQAAYAQAAQGMGRLELTTAFFPLAFILFAVTPVLTLNGHPWRQKWGSSVFDLPLGEHHLQVHFPYLFQERCGPASMMVPIYAGHLSRVTYDAPLIMFSNGTMRLLGTFPMQ